MHWMETPGFARENSQMNVSFTIDPDSFHNVDASTVLLESRVFNESPLNTKKCCMSLTKLLYFFNHRDRDQDVGSFLNENEATSIFFSITKGFQSKDQYLRRLIYMAIKELGPYARDVIIVTSSLVQDINSTMDPICRANAMRTLCWMLDHSTIGGMERLIRQAITDSDKIISSSAVVSCINLFQENRDMVKRIVPADLHVTSGAAKYQALGLLFLLRQNDRVSTIKLFEKNLGEFHDYATNDQTLVLILLLRIFFRSCKTEKLEWKSILSFVSGREAISLEGARIQCVIGEPGSRLDDSISILQMFLGSNRALFRFSGMWTLHQLAYNAPGQVSRCNLDMEQLITDENRSVAMLAMTTLLHTGNETSIDRLMDQIKDHVGGISEELRLGIVESVKNLAVKFPSKQAAVLSFLGASLNQEGTVRYKKSLVQAISSISKPDVKGHEMALDIFCEFVEDCDYADVAIQILCFISQEGCWGTESTRYLRHVYNRLLLETAPVRMAAVGALIGFASRNPAVHNDSVTKLLRKCLEADQDRDIRERIVLFLGLKDCRVLEKQEMYSLDDLENRLEEYLRDQEFDDPVYLDDIPLVPIDQHKCPAAVAEKSTGMDTPASVRGPEMWKQMGIDLDSVGTVLKIIGPLELTETGTEYSVQCTKYIFRHHIVLECACENTVPETVLENVSIRFEPCPGTNHVSTWPIRKLEAAHSENIVVLFEHSGPSRLPLTDLLDGTLTFCLKEWDATTGDFEAEGIQEEYELQGLEFYIGDFVVPVSGREMSRWELECESRQLFSLSSVRTVGQAISTLATIFGQPEGLDETDGVSAKFHVFGIFFDHPVELGFRVVALNNQISVELTARSTIESVAALFVQAI